MRLSSAIRGFESGFFSTRDRSEKTRTGYRCDLRQFREFVGSRKSLRLLQPEIIEQWATHLRTAGYQPASVRRKMACLRVFFQYWVRRGRLETSPLWHVRFSLGQSRQLPRSLSELEMRDLLDCAERGMRPINIDEIERVGPSYLALRNLALVDLLFATGLRVGETVSLNIGDYSPEESSLTVMGKGRKMRLAFLTEKRTLSIQNDYFDVRQRLRLKTSALFLNKFGRRLSTQGVANMIAKLGRDATIPRRVTPHMLRHTVATLLLRAGADLRLVQEFLGHSSITSTQRYTHVAKEHLIEVLKSCHPAKGLRRRGRTRSHSDQT